MDPLHYFFILEVSVALKKVILIINVVNLAKYVASAHQFHFCECSDYFFDSLHDQIPFCHYL